MKYLIALMIGAGILGGAYWKYNSLENEVVKANQKVTKLEATVSERDLTIEAYQKANKTLQDQIQGKDDAQKLSATLSVRVNSLRKSIDQLKAQSANSLQACNRSLATTGELFGESAERYRDVAGKAELLRQDAIALDKHADMLHGLISKLEPLNGLK